MGLRSLEMTSLLRSDGRRVCRQLFVDSIFKKSLGAFCILLFLPCQPQSRVRISWLSHYPARTRATVCHPSYVVKSYHSEGRSLAGVSQKTWLRNFRKFGCAVILY